MKTWQQLKKYPKLWRKHFIREEIIKTIRQFFYKRNFHEVETPTLLPALIPESYLDVFSTDLLLKDGLSKRLFLATSPESSIKKLLVAGIGNCFTLCKSFRNSETSPYHNSEFTMLEWYRVQTDYQQIMRDCEELLVSIYRKVKMLTVNGKPKSEENHKDRLEYQGQFIDLTIPWIRMTVSSALNKYSAVDLKQLCEIKNNQVVYPRGKIAAIAKSKGYEIKLTDSWEEIFHQIFFNEIEPELRKFSRPVILYDYPKPLSALAKLNKRNPLVAERFEFYIAGLELGDCYSELTDYQEQSRRSDEELKKIKKSDKSGIIPDEDFIEAIKSGLPVCSGIAVGVDRLVMLFTNSKTIQEVLFFPQSEF